MATRVARRSQAERTEATTAALVHAARELFARDGYDATSLDAVAARAGVTKGAVYHHFAGKRQLFEAVFSREVERMIAPLTAAYNRKKDPWDAFKAATGAFLEECLEPGVQRIVLLDANAAIGWEGMRRLEAPLLAMMELGISRAVEAGRIAPRPPGPLAHFLFGATCEVAMVVARADDQKAAQRQAVAEIGRVLDSLTSDLCAKSSAQRS
ncbi:TetR family transcriptional regulator [Mycolicibacterium moriokaense]|uniref:TetR family transcriptional regulator n=1 Tax=Mycolicibacterium moriokaense TaxID=39691 RepID=A0AAD1HF70_9MYCO|nr:TetR/AcrR family transcriptional regulator [Mycolicibacterium moriokaense]ORB26537.1 TetR family transcriptional regulator [Mycolicibacterium moriokaense]BBX02903.1 TetR family transcriptional regulator [Mycolicibacterium moriokaense]